MIVSSRRRGPLLHEIFVYEEDIGHPLSLREYRNTTQRRAGYRAIRQRTRYVDIGQPTTSILAGFNATTRNEIRKAQRLGISAKPSTVAELVPYFAEFARQKNLKPISPDAFDWMHGNVAVTAAVLDDQVLAMHSYFYDPEKCIARLFHSASHFRKAHDASAVSAANRFLHYSDMLHFKAIGARWLDLGGIDDGPIGQYKASFGGKVVQHWHLQTWPLAGLSWLSNHFRQIASSLRHRRRKLIQ